MLIGLLRYYAPAPPSYRLPGVPQSERRPAFVPKAKQDHKPSGLISQRFCWNSDTSYAGTSFAKGSSIEHER